MPNEVKHVGHAATQALADRGTDEKVADIEFRYLRDRSDGRNIVIGQPVASMALESELFCT